jgi:nucleoside-diphosphate-sugar epimerase
MIGPGDTSLLPRIVASARRGRLPQIGNGENLVDLTYVENVAQAIMLSMTAPAARGKTYHITNGEPRPLWPLIRSVCERLGVSSRFRPLPYRLAYWLGAALEMKAACCGGEPPLTRYTVAILGRTQTYNITAARRDLGYEPRIALDEGIERTLAYFEEAALVGCTKADLPHS